MSFKNWKRGLYRVDCQAIENGRHIYGTYKLPKKPYNPWWARRRHPGWAAYHKKTKASRRQQPPMCHSRPSWAPGDG